MGRPLRQQAGPQAPVRFDFGTLDVPGQALLERYDRQGRKYLLGLGGVRGGKSWYGARWVLRKAFRRGGKIWVIVPEYEVGSEIVRLINQVLYQHWEIVANHHEHPFPKWAFRSTGPYGPAEMEIHSAYDPDSLIAATLSAAWIDEGARVHQHAFRNIEERTLSTKGPILVTTTPKGKNWVYDELYQPFVQGNPLYGAAILKTVQNPHLPAEEIARLRERWGEASAFVRQELEAEFVTFEGLVYAVFDPARHVVGQVPDKFRGVWAGLDWGFAPDPAACVVVAEDTFGAWWVLYEIYGTRLTIPEFARLVDAAVRQYKVHTVYADPSRPDSIAQMQEAGLPVVAARKIKESNVAIQKISRLLETDRFHVMHSCKQMIREFGLYRYPEKGKRDRPLGIDDHTMDALRYCLWMREPEERLPEETGDLTLDQMMADPSDPSALPTEQIGAGGYVWRR